MVLNRNPTNYFAEVEQIGFSPAALVPGIAPSPDKVLQVSPYLKLTVKTNDIDYLLINDNYINKMRSNNSSSKVN